MGYYIETTAKLGKASQIVNELRGLGEKVEIVDAKEANVFVDHKTVGVVCVVVNDLAFDAAAFVYNKKEFRRFADPYDYRFKTWLLVPREWAERRSGYRKADNEDA